MIKIFLIIPSLNRGGAERVTSILANHLNKELFDVSLVLLEKKGSYLNDLKNQINIIDLKTKKVTKSIKPLIILINKKKPDLVFSTLGHLNLMLMLLKFVMPNKTKFIGREASIPSILNRKEKYPILFNLLYKLLYPKFDLIICQSKYMKKDLIKNYKIQENKIKVINNPLDFSNIIKKITSNYNPFNSNIKNIIAVGSLEEVKGYDLLIKAIAKIKQNDFKLSIIGEGSKKNELKELIKKLQLENKIELLGFKDNPYIYMKYADLGVLSSKFEGFPNTVLETLACKTPVVTFKCPGGVEEIIIENENGWFVENENIDELAKKIEKNLNNTLNKELIYESVYNRYNLNYIIKKYENTFMEILK